MSSLITVHQEISARLPRATGETKLFSTLILAVSSFPRSNNVAMSRLALFACASFFSWSVRRRWIDRLVGRDVGGVASLRKRVIKYRV